MIRPRQGYSSNPDAQLAVAEVSEQIGQQDSLAVLYFASATYDEQLLAREMSNRFACPTWGCASAGVFGAAGYHASGLQAVSLGGCLRVTPFYCARLDDRDSIGQIARGLCQARGQAFALMLLDGLSQKEEEFVHYLFPLAGRVPLVGGSTGGPLDFKHTWLAWGEQVFSGGGLVLLVEVDVPFRLLKFEHSECSERRFVVTASAHDGRVVYELNGKPAALEYARILGAPGELSLEQIARHPWVLELGGQRYLRSIREVRADGGLDLYCRVEEGLVLSAGSPLDPLEEARRGFLDVRRELGGTSLVLGFDCILRRLELEQAGLKTAMADLLKRENAVGFNTFGEQFQALHMNQTFTGVALGTESR
ncbi:FIST C-terminal domain-containing protein [bacterium]|nr:FIST C-terminal domain-containing protein [bacterium]